MMTNPRAHHMRRHATKAEWVLWRELRCYRALGFHIRRQAPFGKYIMDFVAHRERLVIEVDGDQHGLPVQRTHDEERSRFLEDAGYRVLRYANREVLTNLAGVIDGIDDVLKERRRMMFGTPVPPPDPPSGVKTPSNVSTAPQRGR